MGLLSETIEVGLVGTNIKLFKDKGYIIPDVITKKTKIIVNVNDLSPNSTALVLVECDVCKEKRFVKYGYYNNINHNGKYYCNKCSKKVFCGGSKNYCWNPNKTDEERQNGRSYPEYDDFIKKVLARDEYTCFCCGQKHGDLEVHHLNGYNWCISGRTDETNAITLCKSCHNNFHSIYGRGNNTKEQFEEWTCKVIGELQKYYDELPQNKRVYCFEDDCIYDSAKQLADNLNVDISIVYNTCKKRTYIAKNGKEELCNKTIKGKHYLLYDDYTKMSNKDIELYLSKCENRHKKKVVCVTTGLIFDSLKSAADYYNIKSSSDIIYCCKGKTKFAGRLSDGTRLKWMYYSDYTK